MKCRDQGRDKECINVRGLLDAFADGELTKHEFARVTKHLDNCTLCAEELQNIHDLCCMLSAMPRVMPEKQSTPRLACCGNKSGTSLQRSYARWKLPNAKWKYAACVSAAAILILGFWTSWKTSDQFMKLFQNVRNKNVIVPKDCYVASCHPLRSALHLHYTKHRANI